MRRQTWRGAGEMGWGCGGGRGGRRAGCVCVCACDARARACQKISPAPPSLPFPRPSPGPPHRRRRGTGGRAGAGRRPCFFFGKRKPCGALVVFFNARPRAAPAGGALPPFFRDGEARPRGGGADRPAFRRPGCRGAGRGEERPVARDKRCERRERSGGASSHFSLSSRPGGRAHALSLSHPVLPRHPPHELPGAFSPAGPARWPPSRPTPALTGRGAHSIPALEAEQDNRARHGRRARPHWEGAPSLPPSRSRSSHPRLTHRTSPGAVPARCGPWTTRTR